MSAPSLAETQREFFDALLMPLRGLSRKSADLPACAEPHAPAFLAIANRLLRHSPTLLPAECLELYHRQYWFRILDSLEEDFPGLIRLIGKAAFLEVAERYLLEHPSRSFTLRHLGGRLPESIRNHISDPVLRHRALAVAEIECAMMAVFEAPDAVPLPPERIAGGTRITLHPALILLAHQANASDWLHDETTSWLPADDDDDSRFHCAVWRTPTHGTRHTAIPTGAFRMLRHLQDQPMSLHPWLAACADDAPEPTTLSAWFAMWSQTGWFVSEHLPGNSITRATP
ncbi:MAG: putative DNA-binding domain-containing protein [Luteolibacter sp.]